MAYLPILDTQLDPDAPITSGLGYQFRDNPIEMAAGADGAPRVVSRALGSSYMYGNGTYNGATIDTIDMGSSGFDVIYISASGSYASSGSGQSFVRLQGSNDNSAWTTLINIVLSNISDSASTVSGVHIYDGNGGTAYRYYRIREEGDNNKSFTGQAVATFIGGET